MIAIGVGCRQACSSQDIVALVTKALGTVPKSRPVLGLFTIESKRGEPGLRQAAAVLGLPLAFLDEAVLRRAAGGATSRSARIEALFGLPSIAETAALAGAGQGAVLLVPRIANPTATCAIAGWP